MPFKMSVSLVVPNLFGTGDKFCGRHFFHGLGVGVSFGVILVRDIYVHFVSSWASLIAQLVKNPPAIQETLVPFLGREDPLEER